MCLSVNYFIDCMVISALKEMRELDMTLDLTFGDLGLGLWTGNWSWAGPLSIHFTEIQDILSSFPLPDYCQCPR